MAIGNKCRYCLKNMHWKHYKFLAKLLFSLSAFNLFSGSQHLKIKLKAVGCEIMQQKYQSHGSQDKKASDRNQLTRQSDK